MSKESDTEQGVAKRLALADGFHETSRYTLMPGLEVPIWLIYVSRARELIKERSVI